MASNDVPDERTRRLLLRKALRAGRRLNGKRRLHQNDLAAATGLPATAVSRALSGQTELTAQRYQQLLRAIETLVHETNTEDNHE